MLREQISALADGQLEGERFAAVVGKVGGDEEARDSWQMYHLIGDVLRSGEAGACHA
jgi:sigma-E factor negative regulatory protein RseA